MTVSTSSASKDSQDLSQIKSELSTLKLGLLEKIATISKNAPWLANKSKSTVGHNENQSKPKLFKFSSFPTINTANTANTAPTPKLKHVFDFSTSLSGSLQSQNSPGFKHSINANDTTQCLKSQSPGVHVEMSSMINVLKDMIHQIHNVCFISWIMMQFFNVKV